MPSTTPETSETLKAAITAVKLALRKSETVTDDAPTAFQAVARRVPLVVESLEKIQYNSTSAFAQCRECQVLGERLGQLFGMAGVRNPDFHKHYQKAVVEIGSVEKIMIDLLCYIEEGIQDRALQASLKKARKEICQVPSSQYESEKSTPHIFTNSGSGIQSVHMGNGPINNNTGPGPQINGEKGTYYFGTPVNPHREPTEWNSYRN